MGQGRPGYRPKPWGKSWRGRVYWPSPQAHLDQTGVGEIPAQSTTVKNCLHARERFPHDASSDAISTPLARSRRSLRPAMSCHLRSLQPSGSSTAPFTAGLRLHRWRLSPSCPSSTPRSRQTSAKEAGVGERREVGSRIRLRRAGRSARKRAEGRDRGRCGGTRMMQTVSARSAAATASMVEGLSSEVAATANRVRAGADSGNWGGESGGTVRGQRHCPSRPTLVAPMMLLLLSLSSLSALFELFVAQIFQNCSDFSPLVWFGCNPHVDWMMGEGSTQSKSG